MNYVNLGFTSSEKDYGESGEYEGTWMNNKREGYGVMRWRDGTYFEGTWR